MADAPIKMTRAEYEAAYGAAPAPIAIESSAPIKMTRAEYAAKYGTSEQAEPPPHRLADSNLATLASGGLAGIAALGDVADIALPFVGSKGIIDIGDTMRAGIDWATGEKDSTKINPDSLLHTVGAYAPMMSMGLANAAKTGVGATTKELVKIPAKTTIAATGGFAGRHVGQEIGETVGGETGGMIGSIAGEILGSLGTSAIPGRVAKSAGKRATLVEQELVGYNAGKKARPIDIDAASNEVLTKGDKNFQKLADAGFFKQIKPTDNSGSVTRKLYQFYRQAGRDVGSVTSDAGQLEKGLAAIPNTGLNLTSARAWVDDIPDVKLRTRLSKKLDNIEADFTNSDRSVLTLKKTQSWYGKEAKKSFGPKSNADTHTDQLNKAVYADLQGALQKRISAIEDATGRTDLLPRLLDANKRYSAAESHLADAVKASRKGVGSRIYRDILSPFRGEALGKTVVAGVLSQIPVIGPMAIAERVAAAGKAVAPVQARAALRGVERLAKAVDPFRFPRLPASKINPKVVPPAAGGSSGPGAPPLGLPPGYQPPGLPWVPQFGHTDDVRFFPEAPDVPMVMDTSGNWVPALTPDSQLPTVTPGRAPIDPRLVTSRPQAQAGLQVVETGARSADDVAANMQVREILERMASPIENIREPKPSLSAKLASTRNLTPAERDAMESIRQARLAQQGKLPKVPDTRQDWKKLTVDSDIPTLRPGAAKDPYALNIPAIPRSRGITGVPGSSKSAKSSEAVQEGQALLQVVEDILRPIDIPGQPRPKLSAPIVRPVDRSGKPRGFLTPEEKAIVQKIGPSKKREAKVEPSPPSAQLKLKAAPAEPEVKAPTPRKQSASPEADELKTSIQALKNEHEDFALDVEMEDAFQSAPYQVGSTIKSKSFDDSGVYQKTTYEPPEIIEGAKADSDRAKLFESLVKQERKDGRLFSPDQVQAIIDASKSEAGLSFKTIGNKTYKPADKATEDFVSAFGYKQLNREQLEKISVGLKSPVRVNDVDVSPHSVGEPPEGWVNFRKDAPDPESGSISKGAALSLAGAGVGFAAGVKYGKGGLPRSKVFPKQEGKMEKKSLTAQDLQSAIIRQESAGKSDAVSNVGAKGLMQLMDATGKELFRKYTKELKAAGIKHDKYRPFDAAQNKFLGTKYMTELLRQFGNDPELALTAYHSGPGRVKELLEETKGKTLSDIINRLGPVGRKYAKEVLGRMK